MVAACWSPATPQIGMAAPNSAGSVRADRRRRNRRWRAGSPGRSRTGRTAPRPSRLPSSAISMVRLALLASVAWTAPPVSFQISQLSIVPNASRIARRADLGAIGQHPLHLRRAEIGVEEQAGPRLDRWFMPGLLELGAAAGGPPVLPDQRVAERLAAVAIPGDDRFALVGDADRGDAVRRRRPCRPFPGRRRASLPRFRRRHARPSRAQGNAGSAAVLRRLRPAIRRAPNSIARVEVVPSSMTRIYCVMPAG